MCAINRMLNHPLSLGESLFAPSEKRLRLRIGHWRRADQTCLVTIDLYRRANSKLISAFLPGPLARACFSMMVAGIKWHKSNLPARRLLESVPNDQMATKLMSELQLDVRHTSMLKGGLWKCTECWVSNKVKFQCLTNGRVSISDLVGLRSWLVCVRRHECGSLILGCWRICLCRFWA